MDPINHLLVRFLRFLGFNHAANMAVEELLGGNQANIHPDIIQATDLIVKKMDLNSNANFFPRVQSNENVVFQRVAEQFNLFNLPNGGLVQQNYFNAHP
ncbi:hypothetical protein [Legionella gresilensis]|uniref:hypothetical protein n=1 Tax=Legionella gresilensis TaxID=91823 RepID=UPI001041A2DB|nr:hypothetical protein [Legionella gresilensis]